MSTVLVQSEQVSPTFPAQVWTFLLREAVFKIDAGETLGPVAKVKIVAQKAT